MHFNPVVKSGFQKTVAWLTVCAILVSGCISRLYIAAHFPHQVIAGTISGKCDKIYMCKLYIYIYISYFFI